MQYWKPESDEEFAGDMMPFWDGNRFHLFYLLDRRHHAEQGGLGGHQWAHASTEDLVQWEHHPLALPVGAPGGVDQHGICTGSIFEHEGTHHAFYATRIKRPDGSVFEALCRAAGDDLTHFDKSPNNPMFATPPDFDAANHRDPFVFRHPQTGAFHMLVTASREQRGVLAHYVSEDLEHWRVESSPLPPGDGHCPECPEHFFWNGWWYLVHSHAAQMEYWISREPLGPWRRARRHTIEGPNLAVPRSAFFTGGRRLAAGFLPWRRGGRDDGDYVYAGSVVFRELLQDADGTLATRFVPEMMPATGPPIPRCLHEDSLQAGEETHMARIHEAPTDCVLTFRVVPDAGVGEYGLLLRADERLEAGYRLRFSPVEKRVTLQRWPAPASGGEPRAAVPDADGQDQPTQVVVCLKDSIIDVCVNGRHTLIERCFDYRGTNLGLFARAGRVRLEDLSISPLRSAS